MKEISALFTFTYGLLLQQISKKEASVFWSSRKDIFNSKIAFIAVRKLNFLPVFNIRSQLFYIDPYTVIGHSVLRTGGFETGEIDFLIQHVKDNNFKSILDVGANIGLISIVLSELKSVEKTISFEPTRSTSLQLKKNIRLNKLENKIQVENIAVSDKPGRVTFYEYQDNAYNSINNHGRGTLKDEYTVETTSLDNFLNDLGFVPDLIKIDVEGNEEKVIDGVMIFISKKMPDLFIEIFDNEKQAIKALKIINSLKEKGYHVYVFKDTSLMPFNTNHNNQFQNYLFTRNKKF